MQVEEVVFNPYHLFQEIKDNFMPLATAKQLKLNSKFAQNLNTDYKGDALRIRQIITNILSNAVAYTLPGSSIFVRIDNRKLIVENECEPIPAEHLKHIFEPFYRPDYARNQNDGGNGLGLYIVASILDSLKLTYSLEPMQKPLGMRFTITF